ncbi:EF-hand domain-containing protein [Streptoalloteichus hindustanus]|uniref:Ca2+-binding protein, EF-hand superfamily n=1 Tax=Streptoalloteichus hindustanus TaxID=2017 RepID=A0A1M5P381_STRHI|nr:EF-hand domain-containing protein [Streptoalloteichus hindustanus]SHG96250.1 Ca2+-binding protein, EF-hand superfamily [Streptoalloteichus hindustanus]
MAKDAVERKHQRLFDNVDQDNDGEITREDYQELAHRIIQAVQVTPSSEQARRLEDEYDRAWEAVADAAGVEPSDSLTLEDFCQAMARQAADEKAFNRNFGPLGEAEFSVADTDHDGRVSVQELQKVLEATGAARGDASQGATQLDNDNDGFVSKDEYLKAWRDAFTSAKAESPVMGKV